jgi:hypothetical protein
VINAEEWRQLKELQAQAHCVKKFTCITSELKDLCQGKYHSDLDILECLETGDSPCAFARSFGCTQVCACPLRKLIAKNFDRWSAESTAALRRAQGWGVEGEDQ